MILKNASRVLGALATVFLLHGVVSAATVGAGRFDLTGTVYVTNTSFLFGYFSNPTATSADERAAVVLPTEGAFAGLAAGNVETIHNLLTPSNGAPFGPGPVVPGSSFTLAPFVELTTIGVNLDLTGANPIPVGAPPVCSGTSFDAPGSICTAQPGSPVVLSQGSTGVSATMSLSGLAHFVGDTDTNTLFTGHFNASFDGEKISTLLAQLAANGFIRTGWQADFTTNVVPEPASMALIGAGLFARHGAWSSVFKPVG
jgi:hypothetical protein